MNPDHGVTLEHMQATQIGLFCRVLSALCLLPSRYICLSRPSPLGSELCNNNDPGVYHAQLCPQPQAAVLFALVYPKWQSFCMSENL